MEPDLTLYPGKIICVPYDLKSAPLYQIIEHLKEKRRSEDAVKNLLDEEDEWSPYS